MMQLKRPPLPAQELNIYAVRFGNNPYLVLQTETSMQLVLGTRQSLADKLRELAQELELGTVKQQEVNYAPSDSR